MLRQRRPQRPAVAILASKFLPSVVSILAPATAAATRRLEARSPKCAACRYMPTRAEHNISAIRRCQATSLERRQAIVSIVTIIFHRRATCLIADMKKFPSLRNAAEFTTLMPRPACNEMPHQLPFIDAKVSNTERPYFISPPCAFRSSP